MQAGEAGRQALVLRALIEDFGGEVTGAALCRRIAGPFAAAVGQDDLFKSEIRAALAALASRGAVALEDLGPADAIVRITRDGAALADDLLQMKPGTGAA